MGRGHREPLAVGQLRTQRLLRSTATYRVVDLADGQHVCVEVVAAPGLAPGRRMRLTRASVARMRLAAPSASQTSVDDELLQTLDHWAA
jgi:hypothetical protein